MIPRGAGDGTARGRGGSASDGGGPGGGMFRANDLGRTVDVSAATGFHAGAENGRKARPSCEGRRAVARSAKRKADDDVRAHREGSDGRRPRRPRRWDRLGSSTGSTSS